MYAYWMSKDLSFDDWNGDKIKYNLNSVAARWNYNYCKIDVSRAR